MCQYPFMKNKFLLLIFLVKVIETATEFYTSTNELQSHPLLLLTSLNLPLISDRLYDCHGTFLVPLERIIL